MNYWLLLWTSQSGPPMENLSDETKQFLLRISSVWKIHGVPGGFQNLPGRFRGVGGIGERAESQQSRRALHRPQQGSPQERDMLRRLFPGPRVIESQSAIRQGHDMNFGTFHQ